MRRWKVGVIVTVLRMNQKGRCSWKRGPLSHCNGGERRSWASEHRGNFPLFLVYKVSEQWERSKMGEARVRWAWKDTLIPDMWGSTALLSWISLRFLSREVMLWCICFRKMIRVYGMDILVAGGSKIVVMLQREVTKIDTTACMILLSC